MWEGICVLLSLSKNNDKFYFVSWENVMVVGCKWQIIHEYITHIFTNLFFISPCRCSPHHSTFCYNYWTVKPPPKKNQQEEGFCSIVVVDISITGIMLFCICRCSFTRNSIKQMNHWTDGSRPETCRLGQLDYFWFYFSSIYPVICPSDPLLNSISFVFWPLTLERKGKGPRDWKMFQNGWTKITTYSTVHWRTNTRADNNEPAVYGSTAGRWQPLSGLINVLERGMNGDTSILMIFSSSFFFTARSIYFSSVLRHFITNCLSSHLAEWDGWEQRIK